VGLAGGVNTYAYVGNNPVGLVDPSGLLFEWMGGPWTGFGSDISTPGNFSAAFEGAASGYGLGSGLTALAKLGKAVDAALPNCPVKTNDFFEGTRYTNKVLGQTKQGDFHAFPESVKGFQDAGQVTKITGGDGITRDILKIPGEYRGKEGYFEFIKESDGSINHRLFRPTTGQ
jgi:hypothetical protein